MKPLKLITALLCIATCLLLSCKDTPVKNVVQTAVVDSSVTPAVEKAITAEEQAKLTPDTVIQILKRGNEFFSSGKITFRNDSERIEQTAGGQYPLAIILSCIDSRVPVEDVFDRGIGDLFVARVAGNIVNEDILGSMEYACKVSGAKLILVLGHENCGAIKSAIDDVKLGNITALLSKIRPAVTSLNDFKDKKSSKNYAFVHAVCEQNIKLNMQAIRDKSDILKQMEAKGEIKIVGAVYDLHTGHVTFEE